MHVSLVMYYQNSYYAKAIYVIFVSVLLLKIKDL